MKILDLEMAYCCRLLVLNLDYSSGSSWRSQSVSPSFVSVSTNSIKTLINFLIESILSCSIYFDILYSSLRPLRMLSFPFYIEIVHGLWQTYLRYNPLKLETSVEENYSWRREICFDQRAHYKKIIKYICIYKILFITFSYLILYIIAMCKDSNSESMSQSDQKGSEDNH